MMSAGGGVESRLALRGQAVAGAVDFERALVDDLNAVVVQELGSVALQIEDEEKVAPPPDVPDDLSLVKDRLFNAVDRATANLQPRPCRSRFRRRPSRARRTGLVGLPTAGKSPGSAARRRSPAPSNRTSSAKCPRPGSRRARRRFRR